MDANRSTAPERSEVDTTRPFRSVKEAVAVFGERFLVGDAASSSHRKPNSNVKLGASPPKPPMYSAASSPRSYSSSASQLNQEAREYDEPVPEPEIESEPVILSSLKKLETELAETKQDLVLMKKRESEMELAVASLNAQLHKSLSKLEEIEAAKAAESSATEIEEGPRKIRSDRWGEKNGEMRLSFEYLPSLAQALSLREMEDDFGMRREPKLARKKKKPVVPLIGDLFFRKKKSSGDDHENRFLYAQSFL